MKLILKQALPSGALKAPRFRAIKKKKKVCRICDILSRRNEAAFDERSEGKKASGGAAVPQTQVSSPVRRIEGEKGNL